MTKSSPSALFIRDRPARGCEAGGGGGAERARWEVQRRVSVSVRMREKRGEVFMVEIDEGRFEVVRIGCMRRRE